jgi:hypothetical protein
MMAWAATQFADPMYLESMSLDLLVQDPAAAILRAVTLTYQPRFLDILPLYVALMTLLPAVLLLFRVGAFAPLAASLALFGVARWTGLNLPNLPESRSWFFNPFAWQLLFAIGLTVAHLQRLGRWHVPAPRLVTFAAAGYLAFAFAAAAPWTDIPALANASLLPAGALPPVNKTNLSPFRLCNVLAQAWLLAVLMTRACPLLATRAGRAMALAGRNSLDVFALGSVLSTAGAILLQGTQYDLTVQVTYTGAGIAVMIGYAGLIEWRKHERLASRAARVPEPEPAAFVTRPSVQK